MNGIPYLGYLHSSDGKLFIVGPDGFCHEAGDVAELLGEGRAASGTPSIDVDPESVTDREVDRREIES